MYEVQNQLRCGIAKGMWLPASELKESYTTAQEAIKDAEKFLAPDSFIVRVRVVDLDAHKVVWAARHGQF